MQEANSLRLTPCYMALGNTARAYPPHRRGSLHGTHVDVSPMTCDRGFAFVRIECTTWAIMLANRDGTALPTW